MPHCDVWFVGVFPVAPPPPAPYQPSLVNDTLSDDPFNPTSAAGHLQPDCFPRAALSQPGAPTAHRRPRAPAQFMRDELLHAPPPPPSDRFGSTYMATATRAASACEDKRSAWSMRAGSASGSCIRLSLTRPTSLGGVVSPKRGHGFQMSLPYSFTGHRRARNATTTESAGAAATAMQQRLARNRSHTGSGVGRAVQAACEARAVRAR